MARAKPPVAKKKAASQPKDQLPGAYYVAGPKPYLLVVVQFDQDFRRKVLRIPGGQVTLETAEVQPPSDEPEIMSHPVSWHRLTIVSPRQLPVLLRINMGAKGGRDLDNYAWVNDDRKRFHYGQSSEHFYGTIWLNGGRNTFGWARNEGA